MFTRQHRAAVALVVALSFAPAVAPVGVTTAWADAPAAHADATPEAQAKQAYARGAELYKEHKLTAAAEAFAEGNRLKPHYAFLWNLALTHHALGDHQKAIEYYQAYLASSPPTATTDRAAAQAAIAAEQRSLSAPEPTSEQRTAVSLSHGSDGNSNNKPESTKVWRKWWFWTATGAALAAIGVGLGVGLAPATTEPYREVTWR